jgi:hypothetical protein
MLDQTLAQLMQRLLERKAQSTPLSATARRLQDDLGIGRIHGKTLDLSERDRQEMRELLLARGYSARPAPLKDMSRSERLAFATPNEKAGGGPLKTGRVSMKSLPSKTLNVAGRTLSLPDGCHVDSDWRRVANGIGHDSIMLVENYEVFDQLHELAFDLPDDCKNPLVIYRGDKTESRLNNVKAFIDASDLPVLAFVDIDPKGLHIAVGYPRLIGVVAPDYADLKATMDSPASARPDLYRLQLPGVGDYLRSIADNSPISDLWKLLQQHRTGVVQERWLVAGFKLVLWNGKR